MGADFSCCTSSQRKPQRNVEKLQITYKQNLEEISSLLKPKFYVLDLTSNENKTLIEQILNERQQIKCFTSLNELKQFKDDHQNNLLLVCEQNDTFLNEMLPNSKAFQRIAFLYYKQIEDLQNSQITLKDIHGYRFAGLFQPERRNIVNFLETQSISRSIYFCDKDHGFINKSLSIIYFFLEREVEHSFQLFRQYLMCQGSEGKALLEEIEKLLHQQVKLGQIIAKKVAEENKVFTNIINLLKNTFNPGIIAHVSWFYDALHLFVRKSYYEMLPKLSINQVFIVAKLTDQEISFISLNRNFMFSTFMVGYTSLAEAQAVKDKSLDSYIFMVNLPKNTLNKNLPKEDFGFCLVENRVIFTVQTFFKIDKIKKQLREIQVTYGILGKQFNLRRQEFRYLNVAQAPNLNMLKHFDYLAYSKFFVKSETDLLLHLQYYHRYKQHPKSSLTSLNSLINQPESSLALPSQVSQLNLTNISNRSDFSPTILNNSQKLADIQFSLRNIQAAQAQYNNVVPTDRGMIKKLYMYDRCNRNNNFLQTIERLREVQITDEFDNRFLKIALISYNAVMLAQRNQQREAERKIDDSLRRLIEEFKVKFVKKENLHEVSISSFPLYCIILKNAARVTKFLGQNAAAEMHESDYQVNWPFFDGTHINWLP